MQIFIWSCSSVWWHSSRKYNTQSSKNFIFNVYVFGYNLWSIQWSSIQRNSNTSYVSWSELPYIEYMCVGLGRNLDYNAIYSALQDDRRCECSFIESFYNAMERCIQVKTIYQLTDCFVWVLNDFFIYSKNLFKCMFMILQIWLFIQFYNHGITNIWRQIYWRRRNKKWFKCLYSMDVMLDAIDNSWIDLNVTDKK